MLNAFASGTDVNVSNNLTAARTSRVARTGSKVGRVLRMVRFFQLLKLYAQFIKFGRKQDKEEAINALKTTKIIPKQSKVGATLSEKTTGRVVITVLFMLLVFPVFQYNYEDFGKVSNYLCHSLCSSTSLYLLSSYCVGLFHISITHLQRCSAGRVGS